MVQGTCADIMKRALINVHVEVCMKPKWKGVKELLTVHDEIGIEAPLVKHSKALMREIVVAMQGDFHLKVGMPVPYPVGVKVAKSSWADAKEFLI